MRVSEAGTVSEPFHDGAIGPLAIDIATETDGAAWDAYVSLHPNATADHLWAWSTVIQSVFGHRCVYLIARRREAVVGVLPLVEFRSRLFGRFLVSLPFLNYGGLLASESAAGDGLLARAGEVATAFGASHVELRHTERQIAQLPFRQHKLALTLPLPLTVESLWAGLDRKVRNQVRKAQKESLTTVTGGAELADEFYAVFAHNMRDLGTPVYSKRLFLETLQAFPQRAKVFVVRRDGTTMAAAIAIRFRDTVLVPWASSLREFRNLCPNMLLYWAMLEDAVSSGARTFDFGRSSPGGGTHHFKTQWGAHETPMHWEYLLLTKRAAPDHGPSNPKFSRAVDLWSRLPLWVANTIGPVIVRNIP